MTEPELMTKLAQVRGVLNGECRFEMTDAVKVKRADVLLMVLEKQLRQWPISEEPEHVSVIARRVMARLGIRDDELADTP